MDHRHAGLPLTLALCGGYFLVLLDVTVVNIALPSIAAGLGASAAGLAWTVDAYATPLAALLLASGAIGDRLGHRRVVATGFLGFGAASVMCATAPTVLVLTLGRALQGVAAALALPGTLALLTQSAPDERARTRIVALWAAVGGAALPAGPLAGGLLVQHLGWRAVFWVNVPVIAAAMVPLIRMRLGTRHLPAGRPSPSPRPGWLGAAVLTVLIGSVVTAIIEVRQNPAIALVAGLAGLLAAVNLVVVERRSADPLIRVEASERRPLARACVVAGLMNLCSIGTLFVLTQVFQEVRLLPPPAAGALLLPAMLPLPLLGPPAGRVINALGVWTTSTIALAVSAVGFVLIATSLTDDIGVLIVGLTLWGSGLGMLTPAVVTAALQSARRVPGTASGASNTARQIGGALGVAIVSAAAGAPGHPQFIHHAAGFLVGAATVFAVTAVLVARVTPVTAAAR